VTDSNKAVFLGYASEDAEAAQRIRATLRSAGIEGWLDESELRGGDAWDAAIRKQIKACALFMPIISANSCARAEGYFRFEWKLSIDRSHLMAAEKAFILPVAIDAIREVDALVPDKFREMQWMRLPGGDFTRACTERLSLLLSRDARLAPAPVSTGAAIIIDVPRGRTDRASTQVHGSPAQVAASSFHFISPALTVPDKPSIAVLPFSNMSADPEQDYFADGMVEDIIAALSRFNQLFVISRNSSFTYKGRAMAERCDLMVHHGGHSSVMTGLSAGTPAVIIPTITERESNARRVTALGAGEIVLPVDGADGEKHIDVADFSAKVHRVLSEPSYRRSAHRISESMHKLGGIQEATDRIERFADSNHRSGATKPA
jgi:TIR domain/UDP-glucoronosyl and UDP-glucosyl transferase